MLGNKRNGVLSLVVERKNCSVTMVFLSSLFLFVPSYGLDKRMAAENTEVEFGKLDGSKVRIGIIKTRWNKEHVTNIVSGVREALKECNVTDTNIFETEVPGSFELPLAAKFLALSGTVDAIVCCGILIKGDTMHFEHICDAVSNGIMNIALQTSTPCIFGVLTCLNEEQVKKRSTGTNNHGIGWGKTAVEMAILRNEALGKAKKGAIGFSSGTPVVGESGTKKERVGFF